MAEAVFLVDIAAPAARVREALTSRDGLMGWWTDDVEIEGGTISLGFSDAPERFSLRIDTESADLVRWTSVGEFPPHWVETRVSWTVMDDPGSNGVKVFFEHAGFASPDPMLGHTAMVWANLMNSLKGFCETGRPSPLLTGPRETQS